MIRLGFPVIVAATSVLCATSAWCQLETKYGRRDQSGYQNSINGTRALAAQFESLGYSVVSRKTITNRIDRHDLIVWVPDSFAVPSPRLIERIEKWLDAAPWRTFVYVGRDYDAADHYWSDLALSARPPQVPMVKRQRALARARHLAARSEGGLATAQSSSCRWFRYEEAPQFFSRRISGDWKDSVARVNYGSLFLGNWRLLPPVSPNGYTVLERLTVDGHPFAYELLRPNGSRVIVINNGSLVLNYPVRLVRNDEIAELFASKKLSRSPVIFLESAQIEPRISEYDNSGNMWSWIQERPLSFIVPHFLVLGILACFVFFPILGRPRRGVTPAQIRFGEHIESLGHLLRSSPQVNAAREAIAQYQRTAKND